MLAPRARLPLPRRQGGRAARGRPLPAARRHPRVWSLVGIEPGWHGVCGGRGAATGQREVRTTMTGYSWRTRARHLALAVMLGVGAVAAPVAAPGLAQGLDIPGPLFPPGM